MNDQVMAKKIKGCSICGLSDFSATRYGGYYYKENRYSIVKCRKCNFMFLDPLPSQELLDGIYSDNSYFENYHATHNGVESYIDAMECYRKNDEAVINLIKRHKPLGRLFDIGCAGGRFLASAARFGYDVYGIEPNMKMAEYAKNVFGFNVVPGKIQNVSFPEDYFDIIYASDVLEHILELRQSVRTIYGLLKKDGIFVVNQPLVYNRSFFNLLLKANMFFKQDKWAPNPPAHLWEFTPRTLKVFLNAMGFKITYLKVREMKAKPLTAFEEPTLKNKIGIVFKNVSRAISNSIIFRPFELGDRAVVICKKSGK